MVASRAKFFKDKIVKDTKKHAAQENVEQVRLGEKQLANFLHFKHLSVMQSIDRDPPIPVDHRVKIAKSSFKELRQILTIAKLPKYLRLRLFRTLVVFTLLYG